MLFPKNLVISGVTAFLSNFRKKEEIRVPARGYHSLTYRISGSIRLNADGRELVSEAGDVTYVPKGVSYSTEVLSDGQMIALHFYSVEDGEGGEISAEKPERPELAVSLFRSLCESFHVGYERDAKCMSLIYELISELESRDIGGEAGGVLSKIHATREQILKEFSDPSLSVSALAESVGVSEVYYRRSFRALFGTSPLAYLRRVRYDNARAMLKTGYYTVSEVAAACGFSSINYFSSEFRRMSGVSPSEYMKKHNR